jgi:type I restriction enzyme S subunit
MDWLPQVPSHWAVKRLKFFIRKIEQGWSPQCEKRSAEPGEWGVLKVGCMNTGRYDESEHKALPPGVEPIPEREVKVGDVLMSRSNTTELVGAVGKVHQTQGRILLCDKLYRIALDELRLNPDFAVYLLRSHSARYQIEQDVSGASSSMKNISNDRVTNLVLGFPPLAEQEGIVAFLDRETARIDALIERKERLIALLEKKRQAVISHVVTRGLDPSAPLKDSGAPWLGMVPKRWNVSRLKHTCNLIKDGTHLPPPRVVTGYPLLSVRNIVDGQFVTLPDDSMISEADFFTLRRALEVKQNDVLLAIVGATIGKVAVVGEMPPFAIQRSLAVLRPKGSLLRHQYLSYFLQSRAFQQLLWERVSYSAQPGIYLSDLENFNVLLPSVHEQTEIIEFVGNQTKSLNKVLARIRDGTTHLQEYRTALISAAVAGQIDVRDEVSP